MLQVENLNYASESTVLFQRLTVIVSELVLYWAVQRYRRAFGSKYVNWVIAGSVFLHPGLLIYNGFLYGILVHSIVEMKKRRYLLSGFLFAALLNFKHIYLYMAPAYFVYLLKAYCFQPIPVPVENGHADRQNRPNVTQFSFENFIKLGATVVAVFAISLGPFVYMGQIPQLLSRLFPFTRGLCHAFWAPNFWALYAGTDRVLIIVGKKLGWSLNQDALGSMTRGFVGDTKFAVLPQVDAIHTLIITVIAQIIPLQVLWRKPTFDNFLTSLVLCGFASFLFGWHVHEKAILLILIPYSLMAANTRKHLKIFIILSASGIFSLFPLLFQSAETPIKTIFSFTWFLVVIPSLARSLHIPLRAILNPLERLYLVGLVALQLYTDVLHTVIFGTGKLEFLPLMMISIYTAVGVCYGWARLMLDFITGAI